MKCTIRKFGAEPSMKTAGPNHLRICNWYNTVNIARQVQYAISIQQNLEKCPSDVSTASGTEWWLSRNVFAKKLTTSARGIKPPSVQSSAFSCLYGTFCKQLIQTKSLSCSFPVNNDIIFYGIRSTKNKNCKKILKFLQFNIIFHCISH